MIGLPAVIAFAIIALAGCSRSNDPKPAPTSPQSTNVVDYYKRFDPSSLKEVTDFDALPSAVRKHYDPHGAWFKVGGISGTSALVALQTGDYVPMSSADAYVFAEDGWIKVKTWDVSGAYPLTKLSAVLESINNAEEYSKNRGLDKTLSRLNLANPISDLDKNIALDKTYFIGLCEPPGHTPGVGEIDEPLVHTAAHGYSCLPGSGDSITSDDYAKLIDQARAYASTYNAELLRRIRSGAVK